MRHQTNYQRFPNFTQPPPIIEPTLPTIDDSLIENFLIQRNHVQIQSNEAKIFKYFEIGDKDRHVNVIRMNISNLIEQQKLEEINLRNNIAQISPTLWQEKMNLFKINHSKIAELLRQLNKPPNIRKRHRRKKTHSKNKQENVCEKSKTVPEHSNEPKQVQENLEEKYQNLEMERLRRENLKKINDCKRQLTLLDSLIELRSIRRKNSNVYDRNVDTSERTFNEKIKKLKNKWIDALDECSSIENEFKRSSTPTSSEQWLTTLFSNQADPVLSTPMNFNQLLEIRKSWDLCLVNDKNSFGSSIPPGWVLPNSTPSKEWALYLQK